MDDWDKAYLRLDKERPNEFYVKIIEGNPDDFEELDGVSQTIAERDYYQNTNK